MSLAVTQSKVLLVLLLPFQHEEFVSLDKSNLRLFAVVVASIKTLWFQYHYCQFTYK